MLSHMGEFTWLMFLNGSNNIKSICCHTLGNCVLSVCVSECLYMCVYVYLCSTMMYVSSRRLTAELSTISKMGSASLREASVALLNNSINDSPAFAKAITDRATSIRADLKPWDLVAILQTVHIVGDNADSYESLWESISGKLSLMAPKHLLDLLVSSPPVDVKNDIEYRLIKLGNSSMYIDEYVAVLRVLGMRVLGSDDKQFLQKLTLCLITNESLFGQVRYLHACEILGNLNRLNYVPNRIYKLIHTRCKSELLVMPLEECWRTITGFSNLKVSCVEFEKMAKKHLQAKIDVNNKDMFDQVSKPIDFLQFLRLSDWLTDTVLINACTWANNAVYRPATRTEAHRRPTIFEVSLLVDLCEERKIPIEKIQKAIDITVASRGGTNTQIAKPKPLRYRKRRAYLFKPDGYLELGIVPQKAATTASTPRKHLQSPSAYAPQIRASAMQKGKKVPLWKARSNAWYFRK